MALGRFQGILLRLIDLSKFDGLSHSALSGSGAESTGCHAGMSQRPVGPSSAARWWRG